MPIRFLARRVKRFFIYRVLSLDDTPHRIALGVAVGIFVTWTPTIGLQMILTVAISALLKANKFVGVPFVWISNPLTVVPLYGPNYWLGSRLMGGEYSFSQFIRAAGDAFELQGGWFGAARVQAWWRAMWPVFPPLWLGSTIIGLVLGVITYFAVLYGVIAFRKHLHHRHLESIESPAAPGAPKKPQ